jgi:hypothetical protein
MNSGPLAGIGEITLPALQPGSSIMPGKINPVIPEAVMMVAAQVVGNDAAITTGRGDGQLRAERDAARDRPQPAGVDLHPRHRLAGAGGQGGRRASPSTRSGSPSSSRRTRSW